MKEKPNSTRTYDEDGFRRRAACLCVRDGAETEILLVSSSSTPDRFIVPGGGLEPEENAETAAIREVMEEAGVRGSLVRCLGIFENAERRHRTQVFVLQVEELLEEWDDSKSIGRKRKWFSVPSALEELTVSKPVQCNYVQLLANKAMAAASATGLMVVAAAAAAAGGGGASSNVSSLTSESISTSNSHHSSSNISANRHSVASTPTTTTTTASSTVGAAAAAAAAAAAGSMTDT